MPARTRWPSRGPVALAVVVREPRVRELVVGPVRRGRFGRAEQVEDDGHALSGGQIEDLREAISLKHALLRVRANATKSQS